MSERGFDLATFYAQVSAPAREHNALRQDLVRGLKDYYEKTYGYDRYGGETIFQLSERMGQPLIFGFGMLRILQDRRVSHTTKVATAMRAIDVMRYGSDSGLPYGLLAALHFLRQQDLLSRTDVRYVLVSSAGDYEPFAGVDRQTLCELFGGIVADEKMPSVERAYWGHSLLSRHRDRPGAPDMIDLLLGEDTLTRAERKELCYAWIHARQPRLVVAIPDPDGSDRGEFVSTHLSFWVTHMPSWPGLHMARRGLVWLARLGDDPVTLADQYIAYRGARQEQLHAAVADILAEHGAGIQEVRLKNLIESGLAIPGWSPTRRRFYHLGAKFFGDEYLQRASADTSNSVRQWAGRQLQKL